MPLTYLREDTGEGMKRRRGVSSGDLGVCRKDNKMTDSVAWEVYKVLFGNRCANREHFHDRFCGVTGDKVSYAKKYATAIGVLDAIPKELRRYFDYNRYADELFRSGLLGGYGSDGKFYVFNNI